MDDQNGEGVQRLSRDLRKAAATLTPDEARFLVSAYYMMQQRRIESDAQIRALIERSEPHAVLTWLSENARVLETQIKGALDVFSREQELGRWARSQKGIGPVIAAGLLAHIKLERAPTVGHIWRFAGLDPSCKWEKGKKRPHNADLKVLCWKIGESFVKVSGHDDAIYGTIYAERKALEQERNERKEFADQAAASAKRVGKTTKTHAHNAAGKLSPGHIHARAKRYAVKLFLAHYHEVGRKQLGLDIPLPYPIAHGAHAHKIEPPPG